MNVFNIKNEISMNVFNIKNEIRMNVFNIKNEISMNVFNIKNEIAVKNKPRKLQEIKSQETSKCQHNPNQTKSI